MNWSESHYLILYSLNLDFKMWLRFGPDKLPRLFEKRAPGSYTPVRDGSGNRDKYESQVPLGRFRREE